MSAFEIRPSTEREGVVGALILSWKWNGVHGGGDAAQGTGSTTWVFLGR